MENRAQHDVPDQAAPWGVPTATRTRDAAGVPGTPPASPAPLPAPGHVAPLDPDPSGPALALRHLTKVFDRDEVVRDLSLDVPRGSFYGVVGPNGAGKTTTLSMATGLLPPTAGTASILGHDVWQDPAAAKALLGVLPDGLPTFDRLTGKELLTYSALLRGLDAAVTAERTEGLLSALDLESDANKAVVDYSAGMTKKILLACALIHAPRLLLLDEPFEAVDPVSGQVIRDLLRGYVGGGRTVVLSSHVMELVEGLCTHVAVIAQGTVRASGTLDEVREDGSLTDTFIRLVGGHHGPVGGLSWL